MPVENEKEVIETLQTAYPEIHFSPKTLPELISETGLVDESHKQELSLIFEQSKYVGTALEFFYMLSNHNPDTQSILNQEIPQCLILGLGFLGENHSVASYNILDHFTDAQGYPDVIHRIYATTKKEVYADNPAGFLPEAPKIVPGVIFFVPPDIYTHSKAGVTKKEFEWLPANPDLLSKTYFVFGAYEFIRPEVLEKAIEIASDISIKEVYFTRGYDVNSYYNYIAGDIVKNLAEKIAPKPGANMTSGFETDKEKDLENLYEDYPRILEYPKMSSLSGESQNITTQVVEYLDALNLVTSMYTSRQEMAVFNTQYYTCIFRLINSIPETLSQELVIKLMHLRKTLKPNEEFPYILKSLVSLETVLAPVLGHSRL